MSREWKISAICAVAVHLGVLYGFQATLSRPAKLLKDTAVEVTLVAAPAPAAVVAPTPPPQPVLKPAEPLPVEKPEPLPIEKPEPIVQQPQPVVPMPQPPVAVQPAPVPPAISDNSSQTGLDKTTLQAPTGQRAQVNYRHNPKPAYPLAARRRGQEGLVLLLVRVTDKGRAAKVELKQTSGFSLLDAAALKAVRDWEFEPARLGFIPIESEIEVPVRFKLTD